MDENKDPRTVMRISYAEAGFLMNALSELHHTEIGRSINSRLNSIRRELCPKVAGQRQSMWRQLTER